MKVPDCDRAVTLCPEWNRRNCHQGNAAVICVTPSQFLSQLSLFGIHFSAHLDTEPYVAPYYDYAEYRILFLSPSIVRFALVNGVSVGLCPKVRVKCSGC